MTNIIRIQTPGQLADVAAELKVRVDWHEPDEQEVNARIIGNHLDNAMGSRFETIPDDDPSNPAGELNVIITRDGEDYAVVNLATLLSWGSAWGYRR